MSGEQIYLQSCMVCHGDDGSGNMPGVPDLSENDRLKTAGDEYLIERIKFGTQTPGMLVMPPKGGNPNLTDAQLHRVLTYLKQLIQP